MACKPETGEAKFQKVASRQADQGEEERQSRDIEEEVAKVIETGIALGFDFKIKNSDLVKEITIRELAEVERNMSDHSVAAIGESKVDWRPTPFRYFNHWKDDRDMIADALKGWKQCDVQGSKGFMLFVKAKAAKLRFKKWMAGKKKQVSVVEETEKKLAEDPPSIREGICRFFKDHYSQDSWSRPKLKALDLKKLEQADSLALEVDFYPEEVWLALRDCDGNKAPGPDGFNLNFIKENWDVIKEDFMDFLKEFYSDGAIVWHLNQTFLALIPKVVNPIALAHFRPISLVGSLYKLLAKILANRLKKVLNALIRDTQMAFVKGRQIMDNFIIANEGDPLSPLLFNIAIEALNRLLVKASSLNLLKGARCQVLPCVGNHMVNEADWAASFQCKISKLPICYLGLPIGGSPSK
ncbi:hypothetical protein Dsin_005593 [Dipteronia sinensis]|uniref:Reverse transcriptase domain-containing protein n=1 Tax=Dipteronia sinensis TaxID=43782 RepID=A0AAE0AWQ2_9ROSI|nr:hypothetical protein Dsin_005593 [Dipteronia sinensis]